MANQQSGSVDINFTDSRKADPVYNSGASASTNPLVNYTETEDVGTLRAALNTFDAFTYTNAALDTMTLNDMVFAWRACRGNQTSITNYHPAQTARTS